MTLSLVILFAVISGFLTWRLLKSSTLPPTMAKDVHPPPPLRVVDGGKSHSGHMVFSGPIEHNEHGFITTPLKPCDDMACHCRKHKRHPPHYPKS